MLPRCLPQPPSSRRFWPGVPHWLFALLFWLLLAAVAPVVLRADGIVLPSVAAPAVTMPDQRALLVWDEKNQTETLVIESRFAGQGRDFAWVVPLPSKPEITPATRGTLPTLEALFRPVLFGGGESDTITILAAMSALLTLTILLPFYFNTKPVEVVARRVRVFELLTVISIIGILAGIIFPTVGGVGASGVAVTPNGVQVERSVIGDYDVTVLSGESADGITRWLSENKFTLPAAAEPVVSEHARAGGFFAAVRLRRAEDTAESTAPEPLVFRFKTPQPIYPMKLTGAGASGPLEVELFVFGDARAEVDGLRVTACAPVKIEPNSGLSGGRVRFSNPAPEAVTISHEALRILCAGTAIVTRLEGALPPSRMREDLVVRWQPYKKVKWDKRFAPITAIWIGVLAGMLTLTFAVEPLSKRHGKPLPKKIALMTLLAACAPGLATWLMLPTVPVVGGKDHFGAMIRKDDFRVEMMVDFDQAASALSLNERTPQNFRRLFQQAFDRIRANPERARRYASITLPREGDAPGEYSFRQLADGAWRLVWIADNGQEVFVPDMDEKPGAAR